MNQAYTAWRKDALYMRRIIWSLRPRFKKKSYAAILKICLTFIMITLKYNFKSLQKGLYEIVQNAVKIVSQFIWSSESLHYKNRVTKPKTNQPNLKN